MIGHLGTISLCILGALAGPALGAGGVEEGRALYGRYCATCHGPQGAGDGPTSRIISIPPMDLADLSAANGGTFPLERVVRRIDGRDALIAHGSPMPIYGAFFEGERWLDVETPQGQIEVSPPVLAIARYLEAIQVE
ncbi:cytochrome c [Tropicimonas sp. TH_r6]|uniref:c-type cytochrome n=1 Tax=Tropicimonas sp. TH_r6 TaxID=3082085 RepID=UPI0029543B30|nr:cytochrome c [Tropicimonas sp. TH_r6]MDV7142638.1 cytochrome c [Tropicimonas sp. TH_r6]